MPQKITMIVMVEDDQETPKVGSVGDWVNDDWTLLDVKVESITEEVNNGNTH